MAHFRSPIISLCFFILFAGTCHLSKAQNNTSANKYNLEGVYDTLYVDATLFNKISNHKLVFQYYLEGGRFSLHGWTAKGLWGRKFATKPGLILASGNAGRITYDESKYFGDLVLDTRQIKAIKSFISDTTALVLFAPKLLNGIMNYEIMVTSDANWLKRTSNPANGAPPPPPPSAPAPPPTSPTSSSPTSTDVIANPSPPRNFKKA